MALNEFQKLIEQIAGKGNPLTSDILGKAALQYFGAINESGLPQGSTVTYRDPYGQRLEYTDPQGYTHALQRNLDARLANLGSVSESGNRPPVLPLTKEQPQLQDLLNNAISSVMQGLGQLDPNVQANLNAINTAQQQQLDQQFTQQQGQLTADLYGRGINQSTLAGDLAAKLAQAQGLVRNQSLSDAAQRELAVRQFITTNMSDLLKNITGQETQRGIASGQLTLGQNELNEKTNEFLQQLLLEQDKFKASQKKSPLSGILGSLISAGLSFIPGAGPALSGIFTAANKAGNSTVDSQINYPTSFGDLFGGSTGSIFS